MNPKRCLCTAEVRGSNPLGSTLENWIFAGKTQTRAPAFESATIPLAQRAFDRGTQPFFGIPQARCSVFSFNIKVSPISLSIVPKFPAPPRSGSLLNLAPPPALTALWPERERLEYNPIQRDPDPQQALGGLRLRRL